MQSEGLTTTAKLVYASMKELRENGVVDLTKRQLAEATGTHKHTVGHCLRQFVAEEWVEACPSIGPTGGHNPTLYRLSSKAPPFAELLAIEAVR